MYSMNSATVGHAVEDLVSNSILFNICKEYIIKKIKDASQHMVNPNGFVLNSYSVIVISYEK
jgi:hypothetical protein